MQCGNQAFEPFDLATVCEQRLLYGPVVSQRAREIADHLLLRVYYSAAGLYYAMGGDVTEHAAQVFLRIPAQMLRDIGDGAGKTGVAADPDFVPRFVVTRRRAQRDCWRQREFGIRLHAGRRILHRAGSKHCECDAERRAVEAGGLAAVGFQFVARPRRSAQQMIDRSRGRNDQIGKSARCGGGGHGLTPRCSATMSALKLKYSTFTQPASSSICLSVS